MGKYQFSNKEQLRRYLEKMVKDGLEYCAWRAESMLIKLLEERQYDAYDPKMYDRTFELLNSISHSEVIKVNNLYYVEIYYDTDKIRSYPRQEGAFGQYVKWGQHTDFGNEDVSEFIPKWIEKGTPNNPYYKHKGTHSMEDTRDWLKHEYNRLFRIALKKYGNIQ